MRRLLLVEDDPIIANIYQRKFTEDGFTVAHAASGQAALAELDVLDAGQDLMSRHPEVGAVVFETHNLAPFASALRDSIGIPVFSVYSFFTWFHAGLAPRDFGHPGSAPRPWRER